MKIQLPSRSGSRGSVLMVAMLTCVILFVFMASYLYLIKSNSDSVIRSQAWNYAIVVAESGVEEAMAHLNSGVSINNLGVNTWSSQTNSSYSKTNQLGTGSWVVTIIATNPIQPVIRSTGYVPGPFNTPVLTRTVEVLAKPNAGYAPVGAMVVSTSVDFKGMGITTDSFNSTNFVKFPGGLYNSTYAEDNGDVVTASTTDIIAVQNGKIKGTVRTPPNGQTATVSSGGSVGENWWVNGNNAGIEPGRFQQDVNITFPDATLPDTGGKLWLTPVPGNYKINNVTYKYVLTASNPWKIATLDGGVYVATAGVKLQVTSGFALGSKDEVRITGNGDLSLYVSAPNATIGGNGIINDTGLARRFQYFGLPSNTALTFAANAAFVGVIYAPEAVFTLGGGGNNTYDFIGQSVTMSAKMNGHYNFHYDQGTQISIAGAGYAVFSWDEL